MGLRVASAMVGTAADFALRFHLTDGLPQWESVRVNSSGLALLCHLTACKTVF